MEYFKHLSTVERATLPDHSRTTDAGTWL